MIKRQRGPETGQRSLSLQGLIHEMRIMDANSNYTPVLVLIKRGGEDMSALLDQEDVDALHEFLSHYISEPKPNTTCEHAEEMLETYKDYDGPLYGEHCGVWVPHAPHEKCLGAMCDYGCNAEEF